MKSAATAEDFFPIVMSKEIVLNVEHLEQEVTNVISVVLLTKLVN